LGKPQYSSNSSVFDVYMKNGYAEEKRYLSRVYHYIAMQIVQVQLYAESSTDLEISFAKLLIYTTFFLN